MKLYLGLLFLLILAIPVSAQQESIQKGFNWLVSQSSNGNYKDVSSTAMAALALKESQSGFDQGLLAANYLSTLGDTCWPSNSCQVKDTALVLAALESYSKDTDKVLQWFSSSQTPASATGNWYLEIITPTSGTCKVSYLDSEKQVKVSNSHFPDCQNSTFFDLNTCLEPGLLTKNPSLDFNVNCASLGSTKIAMVYQTGNSYYLISEAATTQTILPVRNACYGLTAKSACTVEPSLYANFGLKKARSELTVIPWLEDNYLKTNALQTALLYLSTQNVDQLSSLKQMQSTDGSFDANVYTTAIATLALKEGGSTQEFESAKAWLILKQRPDGSWGDILTTAAVLYAIYDGEQITFGQIITPGEKTPESFCGDYVCDTDESSSTCPADCEEISEEPESFCGDKVCDANEDSDTCEVDCPRGGFPFFTILFILILLGTAVWLYFKFYRKKAGAKEKPSQKPMFSIPGMTQKPVYRPQITTPKTQYRKSKTEQELEKSLGFARKLLRK